MTLDSRNDPTDGTARVFIDAPDLAGRSVEYILKDDPRATMTQRSSNDCTVSVKDEVVAFQSYK